MAEKPESNAKAGPGIFAKAQKRIARTKTKVLQNLGRAEKTTDDTFNDNVQRIEKQQEVAHQLQKELKNYVHCLKDLNQASQSLHTALLATYESDWTDESMYKQQLQSMELLWNDYVQNLQDSAMVPLHTYLQSFPVLKNKISKRGRKMVDYDNARHHLESLQAAKKKDEVKITKAQEDLQEAKKIYESLNNELHVELPDFYNSRVSFYAGLFSSMFGAEYTFHNETAKTNGTLGDIASQLTKDYASFVYQPKRPLSKSLSTNSSDNGLNGDASGPSAPSTPGVVSPSSTLNSPISSTSAASLNDSSQPAYSNDGAADPGTVQNSGENARYTNGTSAATAAGDTEQVVINTTAASSSNGEPPSPDDNNLYEEPQDPEIPKVAPTAAKRSDIPKASGDNGDVGAEYIGDESNKENNNKDDEDDSDNDDDESDDGLYSFPTNNTPVTAPPPNTLYKVQATHKYSGEDVDELTFEPGEVIYVIPFENPEEQDDGWQMGIKQSDGIKGVFPENFTIKLKN